MDILFEKRGKAVIITPAANFTMYHLKNFESELEKLTANEDSFFIFDLKNSTWIDSLGIRCIINILNSNKGKATKPVIIHCNDKIKKIFRTLDIDELVEFKNNLEEAEEYFS